MKNIKYFSIDQNERGNYIPYFEPAFYELFEPYYQTGDSYNTILYRIWGLKPSDFYKYICMAFNATLYPSPAISGAFLYEFKNETSAKMFVDTLNFDLNALVQENQEGVKS